MAQQKITNYNLKLFCGSRHLHTYSNRNFGKGQNFDKIAIHRMNLSQNVVFKNHRFINRHVWQTGNINQWRNHFLRKSHLPRFFQRFFKHQGASPSAKTLSINDTNDLSAYLPSSTKTAPPRILLSTPISKKTSLPSTEATRLKSLATKLR